MIDFSNFERGFFDSKELFYPYHHTQIWTNGKLVYDSDKKRQSKKPNNNVPKNIKGDYDLSIHGNKIVLVDNKDGTTVEAKCHPDDEFDIGTGIKEAFKKLNEKREEIRKAKEEEEKKIKVGDWVEVTEPGKTFSTLTTFFTENNLMKYATKYRYAVTPNKGIVGRVVAIECGKCVIEVANDYELGNKDYEGTSCYNVIYVVGIEGLRKVKKPL